MRKEDIFRMFGLDKESEQDKIEKELRRLDEWKFSPEYEKFQCMIRD